jgi:hypothetical protein
MMVFGFDHKASHPGKTRDDRKPESHEVMQAQGSGRQNPTIGTSMGSVRSL